MVNSAMKCDVSEQLFSVPDDDEDTPEFQKLIAEQTKKIQRRQKPKSKTIAASVFDRALAEVDEMMKTEQWDQAGARHLVALYDRMHAKCYGVEAVELGPTERYNAAMMAANLTKREFGGDYTETVDYMHWVWTKEIRDEKWRRENGRTNARRIGIRLMFGGPMVTDYRVFLARRSHNT